jgi:hypothetical protein
MALMNASRSRPFMQSFVCFTALFWGFSALAQGNPDAADMAEADALRASFASNIELKAADLLDELVFSWTQNPIFSAETGIVVAEISVPIGLGTGLESYLENHLSSLLLHNPSTKLKLVHCPDCTAIVVHSGAKSTVIGKGLNQPEVLSSLAGNASAKYALFLDFEAEKSSLVLRTRITELTPALPIVYARTLSSATSATALLRSPTELKSAADARREYLALLRDKGAFSFPVRVIVRNYAQPDSGFSSYNASGQMISASLAVPPFVWFEAGLETAFTQEKLWSAEVSLGFTSQDKSHDGWSAGGRISRLLFAPARSLTNPDLYAFAGASVLNLRGSSAALFRKDPPTTDQLIADLAGNTPRSSFATYRLGLEMRVKNRISLSTFLETMPTFQNSTQTFGSYVDAGITTFQCAGVEVGFWF